MQVMVNSQAVITTRLFSFIPAGCITRSRSVILNLNVGDQLYVAVPTVGCYYADSQRFHAFAGFRLF